MLGAQLAQVGSRPKPKFTDRSHCIGAIFAHVVEFACGRDHFAGRRPRGGSSELPVAYAENIIDLGR
jgi:hypothetical protein